MKQSSPSCERNKDPILAVLKEVLPRSGLVLEIGSGTGQHAAYFAAHLPRLIWQPTDLSSNFPSIRAWAADDCMDAGGTTPGTGEVGQRMEQLPRALSGTNAEAGLSNLREPLELDLFSDRWPVTSAAAVVCINTIHIVAWAAVEKLFAGAGKVLAPGGVLYAYGPYRYADRSLEPSNEDFDKWLKDRDPVSGVRDFEAVDALARQNGLALAGDRAMPANNRSIWWRKT